MGRGLQDMALLRLLGAADVAEASTAQGGFGAEVGAVCVCGGNYFSNSTEDRGVGERLESGEMGPGKSCDSR